MVGMLLCLNATVAMDLLPSHNAPTISHNAPRAWLQCSIFAILDGMPHFGDSRFLGLLFIYYKILR